MYRRIPLPDARSARSEQAGRPCRRTPAQAVKTAADAKQAALPTQYVVRRTRNRQGRCHLRLRKALRGAEAVGVAEVGSRRGEGALHGGRRQLV